MIKTIDISTPIASTRQFEHDIKVKKVGNSSDSDIEKKVQNNIEGEELSQKSSHDKYLRNLSENESENESETESDK